MTAPSLQRGEGPGRPSTRPTWHAWPQHNSSGPSGPAKDLPTTKPHAWLYLGMHGVFRRCGSLRLPAACNARPGNGHIPCSGLKICNSTWIAHTDWHPSVVVVDVAKGAVHKSVEVERWTPQQQLAGKTTCAMPTRSSYDCIIQGRQRQRCGQAAAAAGNKCFQQ